MKKNNFLPQYYRIPSTYLDQASFHLFIFPKEKLEFLALGPSSNLIFRKAEVENLKQWLQQNLNIILLADQHLHKIKYLDCVKLLTSENQEFRENMMMFLKLLQKYSLNWLV